MIFFWLEETIPKQIGESKGLIFRCFGISEKEPPQKGAASFTGRRRDEVAEKNPASTRQETIT
jgi:hypothetical protein